MWKQAVEKGQVDRHRQGDRRDGRPDLPNRHGGMSKMDEEPPPAQAGVHRRDQGRRPVQRGLEDQGPGPRAQPWSPFIAGRRQKGRAGWQDQDRATGSDTLDQILRCGRALAPAGPVFLNHAAHRNQPRRRHLATSSLPTTDSRLSGKPAHPVRVAAHRPPPSRRCFADCASLSPRADARPQWRPPATTTTASRRCRPPAVPGRPTRAVGQPDRALLGRSAKIAGDKVLIVADGKADRRRDRRRDRTAEGVEDVVNNNRMRRELEARWPRWGSIRQRPRAQQRHRRVQGFGRRESSCRWSTGAGRQKDRAFAQRPKLNNCAPRC